MPSSKLGNRSEGDGEGDSKDGESELEAPMQDRCGRCGVVILEALITTDGTDSSLRLSLALRIWFDQRAKAAWSVWSESVQQLQKIISTSSSLIALR